MVCFRISDTGIGMTRNKSAESLTHSPRRTPRPPESMAVLVWA
jgi:sensor histidine kinase YesM